MPLQSRQDGASYVSTVGNPRSSCQHALAAIPFDFPAGGIIASSVTPLRLAAALSIVFTLHAADPLYERVKHKLDSIEADQLRPGSQITFTPREINAWARVKVPETVPEGLTEPRVELGEGTATGYATVDFLKMRQGAGKATTWFLSRLIEGERPLVVSVNLESANGRCIVRLTRVELSGAVASGNVLDFLVKTFFLPLYPDAKIDEPFDLGYNMDRIDVHPSSVVVTIKK